jgi:hypothetical protein
MYRSIYIDAPLGAYLNLVGGPMKFEASGPGFPVGALAISACAVSISHWIVLRLLTWTQAQHTLEEFRSGNLVVNSKAQFDYVKWGERTQLYIQSASQIKPSLYSDILRQAGEHHRAGHKKSSIVADQPIASTTGGKVDEAALYVSDEDA